MSYPSDLTDAQWALLEPLLLRPGKPGPKHADLRAVVDGILYVTRTGCQWRCLPNSFGPWTRVWSQFRGVGGIGTDGGFTRCHDEHNADLRVRALAVFGGIGVEAGDRGSAEAGRS